jgi:hypothetical protein
MDGDGFLFCLEILKRCVLRSRIFLKASVSIRIFGADEEMG